MPEDATPTAAGLADDSKDADTYSTDGDAAAKSEDAVISSDEFDAGKDDGDFQYSMTNYYTKVK